MFKNRYGQFETETKLRRGTPYELWLSYLFTKQTWAGFESTPCQVKVGTITIEPREHVCVNMCVY